MCGRFTLAPTTKFYERFNTLNRLDGLTARDNIAPTQDVPVIIRNSPNRIVLMRWGLKQHLDNLRRKDSLSGAATAEISVCLGNYSASHCAGSAHDVWGADPYAVT
jgi:hypothetical protein